MKTSITSFLLFLLASIATHSYSQFIAHCTVYNEEGVNFTVYLNGQKMNETPQSNVRIINQTQAYFSAKFVFEDPSIPTIERKMFAMHDAHGAPVDVTYIMKKNKKGEWGVHWKSQTPWPGYIETNKPTVVVVNNGVSQTTTTTTQTPVDNGTRVSFGTPGGTVSFNTGGGSAQTTTQQTTTTVVSGGTGAQSPCSGTILGEDDFNAALRSITARSTDEGKMLSAKQIVSSNCMTTAHVKKIMQVFTDESKKLEIASYAYPYTADKGNYFKLNDEFKNEANIEALYKQIEAK